MIGLIEGLLKDPEVLAGWKHKAAQNSLNLTARVIRKQLPF